MASGKKEKSLSIVLQECYNTLIAAAVETSEIGIHDNMDTPYPKGEFVKVLAQLKYLRNRSAIQDLDEMNNVYLRFDSYNNADKEFMRAYKCKMPDD